MGFIKVQLVGHFTEKDETVEKEFTEEVSGSAAQAFSDARQFLVDQEFAFMRFNEQRYHDILAVQHKAEREEREKAAQARLEAEQKRSAEVAKQAEEDAKKAEEEAQKKAEANT